MTDADPSLNALLVHLRDARSFDFTGYKRASLARRIQRRMSQVGVGDFQDYLDFLQVHPDEFTALFNTVLINVTTFFRDSDAWEYLSQECLPALIANRPPDAAIRVWTAGCASGQEAYTIAIALAEIIGADAVRQRVKIYATDVDDEALAEARQGSYDERAVADIPAHLLESYFDRVNERYVFRKDLRRAVIFGRNDLVQDAPISRVDLLVCRNTLMYFNSETQARILKRFHFALDDQGLLFLGKAEMLLSQSAMFAPVDLRRRVFRKVSRPGLAGQAVFGDAGALAGREPLLGLDYLRNEAFMSGPVAQVVVTTDGLVAMANRQAESVFGVSTRDVGRPFRDLELSYRPVELRRHIEQAQVDRRAVRLPFVDLSRPGSETLWLDIQIIPLVDGESGLLGVALSFQDVSDARHLHEKLEDTNQQLESAYEELQSTNEELETTNEELQSTVEELETTNEELQSTNEELETMNEELQSTNDELQYINDQLRDSTSKLDDANAFLAAVLTSLRAGVAVLDRDLRVKVWNRQAEDLWGLRSAEAVGQHLLNLDIGLPTDQLRPLIRTALADGPQPRQVELSAVNRRGRAIDVRVECSPLRDAQSVVSGVVLVMETDWTLSEPAANPPNESTDRVPDPAGRARNG